MQIDSRRRSKASTHTHIHTSAYAFLLRFDAHLLAHTRAHTHTAPQKDFKAAGNKITHAKVGGQARQHVVYATQVWLIAAFM